MVESSGHLLYDGVIETANQPCYTQYQKPVSKHMMEVLGMIDTILVGKQIASLRKAKGLTQNQLGERLNISFQAVSKWERGDSLR